MRASISQENVKKRRYTPSYMRAGISQENVKKRRYIPSYMRAGIYVKRKEKKRFLSVSHVEIKHPTIESKYEVKTTTKSQLSKNCAWKRWPWNKIAKKQTLTMGKW